MVEVLVRHQKRKSVSELSDEDMALIQSKKILEEDYDFSKDKDFSYFVYDYMMLDFKDIADILRLDDEHVQIIKYNGNVWVLKIKYEDFRMAYVEITGRAVRFISSQSQKDLGGVQS